MPPNSGHSAWCAQYWHMPLGRGGKLPVSRALVIAFHSATTPFSKLSSSASDGAYCSDIPSAR